MDTRGVDHHALGLKQNERIMDFPKPWLAPDQNHGCNKSMGQCESLGGPKRSWIE